VLEQTSARLKDAKEQRDSESAGIERAHAELGAERDPLIEKSKKLADAARKQKAAIEEMGAHQARILTRLRWLLPCLPELGQRGAAFHVQTGAFLASYPGFLVGHATALLQEGFGVLHEFVQGLGTRLADLSAKSEALFARHATLLSTLRAVNASYQG
jgi:hypothetical protein